MKMGSEKAKVKKTMACEMCGKSFSCFSYLNNHLRKHLKNELFECSTCLKTFRNSQYLKRHQRIHISEKSFECQICFKTFAVKEYLNVHFMTHMKERVFECNECCKAFCTPSTLSRHKRTHINKNTAESEIGIDTFSPDEYAIASIPEYLEEDNSDVSQNSDLSVHQELHAVRTQYECENCGKFVPKNNLKYYDIVCEYQKDVEGVISEEKLSEDEELLSVEVTCPDEKFVDDDESVSSSCELDEHENTHATATCEDSGKFVSKNNLKQYEMVCECLKDLEGVISDEELSQEADLLSQGVAHHDEQFLGDENVSSSCELVEHENTQAANTCENCGKFIPKNNLKNCEMVCECQKDLECVISDERLSQEVELLSQQVAHHNENCFEDDENVSSSYELDEHENTHATDMIFECHFCFVTFPFKCQLKKHMRKHTNEKPYVCQFCYKRFTYPNSFKRHQKLHTGEKPFKCEICERKFSQKNNLIRHEIIHTGIKPFECDICFHTFCQKSDLVHHKRTHFVEKPFKCDICRKTFCRKTNLKRHEVTHFNKVL